MYCNVYTKGTHGCIFLKIFNTAEEHSAIKVGSTLQKL